MEKLNVVYEVLDDICDGIRNFLPSSIKKVILLIIYFISEILFYSQLFSSFFYSSFICVLLNIEHCKKKPQN